MVHQQWRRPCRLCSLSGRTSASSSPLPAPRRMGPDGQLHETRMGNCALAVVEATAHPPRGGNALADGSHSNTLLPIFVDGIIRIIIVFQCLKLCHFEQALYFVHLYLEESTFYKLVPQAQKRSNQFFTAPFFLLRSHQSPC